MKKILRDEVDQIKVQHYQGADRVLLKLTNGGEYVAIGEIERIGEYYYCHFGFETYTSPH